jgi:hypothetical protein
MESQSITYISSAFIQSTFKDNNISVRLITYTGDNISVRVGDKLYESTVAELTLSDMYLLRNFKQQLLFNKCIRKAFDELEEKLL